MYIRSKLSLMVLLLIFFCFWHGISRAQSPLRSRVIVMDCVSRSDDKGEAFALLVKERLIATLVKQSKQHFEIVSEEEIAEAARKLEVKTRTGSDLLSIAREIKADGIIECEFAIAQRQSKRQYAVGCLVRLRNVSLDEFIAYGNAYAAASAIPQAVDRTTNNAIKQVLACKLLKSKIVQVIKDIVVLDCGLKGGLKAGDNFVIVRNEAGNLHKTGKVRVARAYALDAEAEMIEGSDFRAGDTAVRIYERREYTSYFYHLCPSVKRFLTSVEDRSESNEHAYRTTRRRVPHRRGDARTDLHPGRTLF